MGIVYALLKGRHREMNEKERVKGQHYQSTREKIATEKRQRHAPNAAIPPPSPRLSLSSSLLSAIRAEGIDDGVFLACNRTDGDVAMIFASTDADEIIDSVAGSGRVEAAG